MEEEAHEKANPTRCDLDDALECMCVYMCVCVFVHLCVFVCVGRGGGGRVCVNIYMLPIPCDAILIMRWNLCV